MGSYIYCVVPPAYAPQTTLRGVDDLPVELLTLAGLGLWTSATESVPEPNVNRIKQHNAVVEAAIGVQVTPVPVRFGQWSESLDSLEETFGQRADHFRKLLALFEGALEFGLRVLDPAPAPVQPAPPGAAAGSGISGREYLTALRDRLRPTASAEALKQKVHEALAGTVRAERMEVQQTPHAMLSFAHLVPRTDFERYRSQVQLLRAELSDLKFLVSGPWPPYSFAS